MVVVDHGGKHHSLYAHLAEPRGQVGQKVNAGWRAVVSGG
jgi:septal ring factor EnvC (AmiA/AmiB activator)